MPILLRFSALILTLALSACAGRAGSGADGSAPSRSGVEAYGVLDIGIGHQSVR